MFAAFFVVLLLFCALQPKSYFLPKACIPWFSFCVIYFIGTFFFFSDLYASLVSVAKISFGSLCICLFHDSEKAKQVAFAFLFVAVVNAFYLIAQKTHPLFFTFKFLPGHSIYQALLIGFGLFVCLAFFLSLKGQVLKQIILCVLGGILFAGLWILNSRGVFLGVLFGVLVILPRFARWRFFVFVCILFLLFFTVHSDLLLGRLKVDVDYSEWLGRFYIWKIAMAAISTHPFLGVGLGHFEYAYMLHQIPVPGVLHFDKVTGFAHNDFLQLAVTVGLPITISFFMLVWRAASSLHMQPRHPLQLSGVAGLLMFAAASLFDFTLYLPLNILLFSLCCALALTGSHELKEVRKSTRLGAFIACGFIACFLAANGLAQAFVRLGNLERASSIMPLRSDLWYARALSTNNNQEAALHYLNNALRWNDLDPFIYSRKALFLGNTPMRARAAEDAHRAALARAPKHAPFWIYYGLFNLQSDRLDAAMNCFREATRLEPNASLPYYLQSLVLARAGKSDSAKKLRTLAFSKQMSYGHLAKQSAYANFLFSVDMTPKKKIK